MFTKKKKTTSKINIKRVLVKYITPSIVIWSTIHFTIDFQISFFFGGGGR